MRKILSILLSLLMIISVLPMTVISVSANDSTNQVTYTMQDNSNRSVDAEGNAIASSDVFFGVPSGGTSSITSVDTDGDAVNDKIVYMQGNHQQSAGQGVISKRANLSGGFTYSTNFFARTYSYSSSYSSYFSVNVGDMAFRFQVGRSSSVSATTLTVWKDGVQQSFDEEGTTEKSVTPYTYYKTGDLKNKYGIGNTVTIPSNCLNVNDYYGGIAIVELEGNTMTLSFDNTPYNNTDDATVLYTTTVNKLDYEDAYVSAIGDYNNGNYSILDAEITITESIADKAIYDEYYTFNSTNFTAANSSWKTNANGKSQGLLINAGNTTLKTVATAKNTMDLTDKEFRYATQLATWKSNVIANSVYVTYKFDFGAFYALVAVSTANTSSSIATNHKYLVSVYQKGTDADTLLNEKTITSYYHHRDTLKGAGYAMNGVASDKFGSTTYLTALGTALGFAVSGDGDNNITVECLAHTGAAKNVYSYTFNATELGMDLSTVKLIVSNMGKWNDREIVNGYIYTLKERVSDIKARFDEAAAYDATNYTEDEYANAQALIEEYEAMTDEDIKAYLADSVADIEAFIALVNMLDEEISDGYTIRDLNSDMLAYKDLEVTEDVDIYNKAVELKNTYESLENEDAKTYLSKYYEYVNDYIIEYNNAKFIVTIEPSDKYGSYTLSAKEILVGDTVTITAEALDNTAFVAWKDSNGNVLSQTAAYTIDSVAPVNRLTLVFEETTHNWVVENVEPTCYSTGSMTKTCDFCGKVDGPYTLTTADHEYESTWTVDVEATCTSDGSKSRHCVNYDNCGASTDVTTIDIVDHDMGSWSTVTGATCTEDGEKTRKCNDCEYTETNVIEATGHDCEWITRTNATCTEDGFKEYVCGTCEEVVDSKVIEATGHDYSEVIDTEATCTERGQKHQHCSECGNDSDYEDILILEHDFYEATVDGETILVCVVCGNNFDVHTCEDSMEEVEVVDAPTCTDKGSSVYACNVCGYEELREVAATGHNYSTEWTIDAEPNCTDVGSRSHHCTNANCDSKVDISIVAEKGHNYSDWSNTIDPTCTEPGTAVRTCTVCWEDDEMVVPATGHTAADEWTVDVEPTCTEEGSKSHHCVGDDCDVKLDVTPVSALGHKYEKYVNVPVTCITNGYNKQKCIRCNALKYNIVEYTTGLPESDHDYVNDANSTYNYSVEGAEKLYVTFSDECSFENGSDYIEIYDMNNNLIDRYTGTEIASQTIEINGSKVVIKLITDSFVRDYGFAVTKITANMGDVLDFTEAIGHDYKTTLVPATTTEDGSILIKCNNCEDVHTNKVIYKASDIALSATLFVHDGTEKKPTVTVKDSNGNSINTDYYSSYVSTNGVSLGKQTVVVEFKGNYAATQELTYVIVPGKVTGGKAASVAYNSLKLTWTKYAGVTGYEVYRSTSKSGTYKKVTTLTGSSKTTYTDTGLTAGKTYYYKVRAFKSIDGVKNYGSYSSVFSAKPVPNKMTISSVKNSASKTITVKANKQSGVTGYEFYRATSKSGTYKKVYTTTGASKTTYTNTGLTKGKTYYYKVRAYKAVNGKKVYGAYSSVKYAKVSK